MWCCWCRGNTLGKIIITKYTLSSTLCQTTLLTLIDVASPIGNTLLEFNSASTNWSLSTSLQTGRTKQTKRMTARTARMQPRPSKIVLKTGKKTKSHKQTKQPTSPQKMSRKHRRALKQHHHFPPHAKYHLNSIVHWQSRDDLRN